MKRETVTHWMLTRLRWLFETDAEALRRISASLEQNNRRELELERLDRLRNPGNYRGR